MKKQESDIRNVDQVKPETGHMNQPPDNACCILTRITDATYARLARRSYPLSEQYSECYYGRAPEDTLNLAQYYTGMRCLFGKPSNLYDDWKGSFSFVFQVDVFRNKNVYTYLLNILHLRSYIEFRFRKIVDDSENHNLSVYREPLENEFSGEDMQKVECFMYGFLLGYLRAVQESASLDIPDFILLSCSNHIISGYIDGKFFERQAKSEADFHAEENLFRNLIRYPVARWPGDTIKPVTLTIKLEKAETDHDSSPSSSQS